jgi:hypothetical protein
MTAAALPSGLSGNIVRTDRGESERTAGQPPVQNSSLYGWSKIEKLGVGLADQGRWVVAVVPHNGDFCEVNKVTIPASYGHVCASGWSWVLVRGNSANAVSVC